APKPAPKPAPRQGNGCRYFTLEPHENESLEDIAADFGVDVDDLARQNGIDRHASRLDRPLRACTTQEPLHRQYIGYLAEPGDTWQSLALRFQVPEDRIRRFNPDLGSELRAGDWIQLRVEPKNLPAPRKPPELETPDGAAAVGKPGEGELWRGVQLHSNPLYEVRCARHAYGATSAIETLNLAIQHLREVDGYTGTIIVGDMSKEPGGSIKRHLSHQSGRDVDIWLPIKGGTYRQSDACKQCGTKWCKVSTRGDDVDWDATYKLLRALHTTGRVQYIFLDFPPARANEARRGPAKDAVKLVTHMDNHTNHMHVRFKCSEADKAFGCRN
ncbi:MAG TPA: penicillin-insensitive murein endopeptidase, partial [Nannocystaceae bacterium]|nr:penicillin-insensitive murein endopeptidase [Nannocystaceae bacterium]